jgi:hypothetical protein
VCTYDVCVFAVFTPADKAGWDRAFSVFCQAGIVSIKAASACPRSCVGLLCALCTLVFTV